MAKITVPITITNAKLILDAVQNIIDEANFKDDVSQEYEAGFHDFGKAVVSMLEKLKEKDNQSDWIPVEILLPKSNEEVLVQDLFENIFIGKIYAPAKHNGKYGSYFINIQNHCVQTGVAWMPKPTPFKGSEMND